MVTPLNCGKDALLPVIHATPSMTLHAWFYRQLSQPTTDDIEMRVCRDEDRENEDIQNQAIDLYVQ
jgi:hypothetical protein